MDIPLPELGEGVGVVTGHAYIVFQKSIITTDKEGNETETVEPITRQARIIAHPDLTSDEALQRGVFTALGEPIPDRLKTEAELNPVEEVE